MDYRFRSPYYIVDRLFGAGEFTELYNVDRVSNLERLDVLLTDYSKLPAQSHDVPELDPLLPGDLGSAIVNSQQPLAATYVAPGYDPNDALRKEEAAQRQRHQYSFRMFPEGSARGAVAGRCQCRF